MAFKFVAFLACVAAASAGVIQNVPVAYSAPAALVKSDSGVISAASDSYEGYSAYPQGGYSVAPASYEGYSAPATYAQPTYHAAPVIKAQPVLTKTLDEYDPHPQYKFGYDVQDSVSGDSKSQVESRDGDVVQGEYSLIDADGYKRTVQYTADPEHGFNAVVHREPIAVKAVAKAAPVAYAAAPVEKSYAAPVAYAAAPATSYGH